MNDDINIRAELVGLTFTEFTQKYSSDRHRIVKINGEPLLVTRDMVYDRINLEIYNDIITDAYYG